MTDTLFTPDVVNGVLEHLAAEHADDCLLIVRSLAGVPAASARATAVSAGGIDFATVLADGTAGTAHVAWTGEVRERADIRAEVVRLHERATAETARMQNVRTGTAPQNAARPKPGPRVTHVVRTERLSASLVRVVVGGPGLEGFSPQHADAYVKLMFLHPDAEYPRPIDPEQIKQTMPPEFWPRLRTYTVRSFDPAALELTIDFVVHGDTGLAGPWAASAQVGDELLLLGPGGGYIPSAGADWHLLAGDESALPAIAAALEQVPAGRPVQVFCEVHDAADEIALPGCGAPTSRAAEVTWLHRQDAPVGTLLVEAVRAWDVPAGTGHLFVHGEAGAVKALRRLLRVERGIPLEQLSISGYWRQGIDDEQWRTVKREWNREVEDAERAAAS